MFRQPIDDIKKEFAGKNEEQIKEFFSGLNNSDFEKYLSIIQNFLLSSTLRDPNREAFKTWNNIAMHEKSCRDFMINAINQTIGEIDKAFVDVYKNPEKKFSKNKPTDKETKYSLIKELINTMNQYKENPPSSLDGLEKTLSDIKETVGKLKLESDLKHENQFFKMKDQADISIAMVNIGKTITKAQTEYKNLQTQPTSQKKHSPRV